MTRILVVNVKVALLHEVEEDGELTSATMSIVSEEQGVIGMLGPEGEPVEDAGRSFETVESAAGPVPDEWDGVLWPLVAGYLTGMGLLEEQPSEGGEE